MRRVPNPWIAVPSLLLGILAGTLGWVVTDVSCTQGDGTPCFGWSLLWSLIAFLGVSIGVALVLVLVYRSLAEWRESQR